MISSRIALVSNPWASIPSAKVSPEAIIQPTHPKPFLCKTSTIIGWYFFGEANIKYLFGKKAINIYRVLVMISIFIGSTQKVDLVWELADLFNGLMVIPNLIALLLLNKLVLETSDEYDKIHEL